MSWRMHTGLVAVKMISGVILRWIKSAAEPKPYGAKSWWDGDKWRDDWGGNWLPDESKRTIKWHWIPNETNHANDDRTD